MRSATAASCSRSPTARSRSRATATTSTRSPTAARSSSSRRAHEGDVLTAVAHERSQVGRNGVYDVEVRNQAGATIAHFRGKSTRIKGHVVEGRPPRSLRSLPPRGRSRAALRRLGDHMTAKTPRPEELEPIERASRDELRALQLARLQLVARARLRERAALSQGVRRQGRASARPRAARGPREVPVHRQDRPARQLSVRHVRRAARAGRAHPRVVGHDGQAHRRRLHAQRHRHVGHRDGALDPRGGRPRRRHPARRVRLRPLHRRARRALRRGEAGLHGRSRCRAARPRSRSSSSPTSSRP